MIWVVLVLAAYLPLPNSGLGIFGSGFPGHGIIFIDESGEGIRENSPELGHDASPQLSASGERLRSVGEFLERSLFDSEGGGHIHQAPAKFPFDHGISIRDGHVSEPPNTFQPFESQSHDHLDSGQSDQTYNSLYASGSEDIATPLSSPPSHIIRIVDPATTFSLGHPPTATSSHKVMGIMDTRMLDSRIWSSVPYQEYPEPEHTASDKQGEVSSAVSIAMPTTSPIPPSVYTQVLAENVLVGICVAIAAVAVICTIIASRCIYLRHRRKQARSRRGFKLVYRSSWESGTALPSGVQPKSAPCFQSPLATLPCNTPLPLPSDLSIIATPISSPVRTSLPLPSDLSPIATPISSPVRTFSSAVRTSLSLTSELSPLATPLSSPVRTFPSPERTFLFPSRTSFSRFLPTSTTPPSPTCPPPPISSPDMLQPQYLRPPVQITLSSNYDSPIPKKKRTTHHVLVPQVAPRSEQDLSFAVQEELQVRKTGRVVDAMTGVLEPGELTIRRYSHSVETWRYPVLYEDANDVIEEVAAATGLRRKVPMIPRSSAGNFSRDVGFGLTTVVAVCTCEETAQSHAVKTVQGRYSEKEPMVKELLLEAIALWGAPEHENILKGVGFCLDSHGPPLLVTEVCSMSLIEYLRRQSRLPSSSGLEAGQQLDFALQLALGMAALADKNIVHGNLDSDKVLLKAGCLRIRGMGTTTTAPPHSAYYNYKCRWHSLEVLGKKPRSPETDVWSYGIILWEIGTLGELPYGTQCSDSRQLLEFLSRGERLDKPEIDVAGIYTKVAKRCWRESPKERPSMSEIIRDLDKLKLSSPHGEYLSPVKAD